MKLELTGAKEAIELLAPSKGRTWALLHSWWIVLTFTLGFFSWLAFLYIGLTARHPRWMLWALVYAIPLIVLLIFAGFQVSQSWAFQLLNANLVLSIVSIVHALRVRKEYLLRLELLQREPSNVSITTRGKRWELGHSLWILWTFTFLLNWLALIYIGLRVRRVKWILWGLLYSVPFVVLLFTATPGGNRATQVTFTLMIVLGIASIVHAFLVRGDYLLRLENRMQEAAESEARRRQRLEAEFRLADGESPRSGSPEQPKPSGPATNGDGPKGSDTHEKAATSPPSVAPALTPVEVNTASSTMTSGSLQRDSILDTYPLPIAFSWALLTSLWDPRERYTQQLRHAENMLAFLGSVSLALLQKQDYKEAEIDLKVPWQGGIAFGSWREIVRRSAKVFRTYKDNPLALAIHRLNISSEKKGFGADIAALISARNDHHHGRGPIIEEDVITVSNEAQERLQRCMEALSFLAQYPIRLVQDFDLDRRSGEFSLKCLRLAGDGPGFPQERVLFPRAFTNGELLLDLGHQRWVPLHPFIVVSNCPRCRYRETYFIDRWNDRKGVCLMKSFERGHPEERSDISEFLAILASEEQKPRH